MSRHFNNVGEKASRYQGEHFRQSKQKIYAIGVYNPGFKESMKFGSGHKANNET